MFSFLVFPFCLFSPFCARGCGTYPACPFPLCVTLLLLFVTQSTTCLPRGAVQLKFLNIPLRLARDGLLEAVLTLAGYQVQRADAHPVRRPEAGSNVVLLLRYRHGMDNSAVLIADVLPPEDDPHLHRLPAKLDRLTPPGEPPMWTLLTDDPLHPKRMRQQQPAAPAGATVPVGVRAARALPPQPGFLRPALPAEAAMPAGPAMEAGKLRLRMIWVCIRR